MARCHRCSESGAAVFVAMLVASAVALAVAGGVHFLGGMVQETYHCQGQAVARLSGSDFAGNCAKDDASPLSPPSRGDAPSQSRPVMPDPDEGNGVLDAAWRALGIGAAAAAELEPQSNVLILDLSTRKVQQTPDPITWSRHPQTQGPKKDLRGTCPYEHGCRLSLRAPELTEHAEVWGAIRDDQVFRNFCLGAGCSEYWEVQSPELTFGQSEASLRVPPGDFEMVAQAEVYWGGYEGSDYPLSLTANVLPLEPHEAMKAPKKETRASPQPAPGPGPAPDPGPSPFGTGSDHWMAY